MNKAIRKSKVVGMVGGLLLGATAGTMVLTNPGIGDYETFAADALATYLKQEVCVQVAQELGGLLTSYCKTVVDTGRPQIRKIIGQKTVRANYLLFSIYTTQLRMPSPVPSYQFQTLGILSQFYILQAEEL